MNKFKYHSDSTTYYKNKCIKTLVISLNYEYVQVPKSGNDLVTLCICSSTVVIPVLTIKNMSLNPGDFTT